MSQYADILKSELESRIGRNPSYSLRAFARDLEISPSRLSEVMNKKGALSHSKAVTIARKLGLSAEKQRYFVDLVSADLSSCEWRRKAALKRLDGSKSVNDYYFFKNDEFFYIKEWHHLAILEMVAKKPIPLEQLFLRFDIENDLIFAAVERLERLDLVDYSDGIVKHSGRSKSTKVDEGVAPEAMIQFHREIIDRAKLAITEQRRDTREFGVNIHSVSPSAIPEIKEEIRRFRRHIVEIAQKYEDANEVFSLSIQFFSLEAGSKIDPSKGGRH